jgi:hypothetical protein
MRVRATKPEDYWSGCAGKLAHPTVGTALKHTKKAGKHGHGHVYRCRHCGFWHVGNDIRRFERKPRIEFRQEEDYDDC